MPRKAIPLPSLSLLKSIFYLTNDGRLINKISRTSRVAGVFADEHLRSGYRTVYAGGRLLSAHRVVWAIFYGEEPPENIDHINGDPLDNRPSNLRAATHSQNLFNQKLYRSNTSGVKGIHKRRDNGMWRTYVTKDGERQNIGQFASKNEARLAVEAARREAHGNFARQE